MSAAPTPPGAAPAGAATFGRAAFAAALATRRLGRTLLVRDTVASTNDAAWDALAGGAPDGAVVVAGAQTAGRGRAGRAWHHVPGRGLALSVLLHQGCDRRQVAMLPLVAGLALAVALERLGARPRLKWPNDVLLGGRKAAGLLAESRTTAAGTPAAVLGAGVNVSHAAADFPAELRARATSLAIEGVRAGRERVAAEFLNALEPRWDALQEGGREALLRGWSERCDAWDAPVVVRAPGGDVRGIARGLDPDGGLRIERADGTTVTVLAGDVGPDAGAEGGA